MKSKIFIRTAFVILTIISIAQLHLYPQTCSCASTPILSEIGIFKDDVIRTINGIELNNVAVLSGLFNRLKNENQFAVAIERNGEPMRLIYIVK